MTLADTGILATLKSNGTITELEEKFLTAFINGLYAEPHFSDQDVKDIAHDMGVTTPTAKGVLGSLVKKDFVDTEDSGTGYDIVYLRSDKFYLHTEWRENKYDGCEIPEELLSSFFVMEAK